jgi:hypothetical protein
MDDRSAVGASSRDGLTAGGETALHAGRIAFPAPGLSSGNNSPLRADRIVRVLRESAMKDASSPGRGAAAL